MSSFHQQQQQFYGQGPPQQHIPPAYGAPYGGNPNQPVFPGFQNVSPEMINFGLNAGQDILNKQKDKWMPGVSGFWLSLKYYFSVSNSYVLNKLLLILYPLSNKSWNRISADEFERAEVSGEQSEAQLTRKWALPKQDNNAPDLYIPLMAFITYILLYGFYKGTITSTATFSPDIIIQAIWRCLILQLVESGAVKLGTNFLSFPTPFLDCFSFTGYKYVALCVNTIARLLNGTLNFLVSLYTCGMLGYFVLKTVAAAIPPVGSNNSPTSPRLIVILVIAASQLLLTLIMSLL